MRHAQFHTTWQSLNATQTEDSCSYIGTKAVTSSSIAKLAQGSVRYGIQGRDRGDSVEALVTAFTQQPASPVNEADSVFFQSYSRCDMQSYGSTRNSNLEFAQTVMTPPICEHQWDDRTGSDADHDVQDVPLRKHRWTDDTNTVSISTELDELIATSERGMNATTGGVLFYESAEHTTTQWTGRG